jgi:hypothetical protein
MLEPMGSNTQASPLRALGHRRRTFYAAAGLISGVIIVGGVLGLGVHRHAARRVKHATAHPPPSASPTENISYESFSLNPLRRHIRFEKLRLGPPDAPRRVAIDAVTVRRWNATEGIPTQLRVEIEGLHIDSDHPWCQRLLPHLPALGYKHLLVHIEIAYRFYRRQKMWDLHRLHITAPRLGELELKLSLGNIELIRLLRKPRDVVYLLQALPEVVVREATLSYRDDSLVRRLYGLPIGAKQRRLNEVVREVRQRLERRVAQTGDPASRRALTGLGDFLADPDGLEASLRPQQPVPLVRLLQTSDIQTWIKLLGLQIKS